MYTINYSHIVGKVFQYISRRIVLKTILLFVLMQTDIPVTTDIYIFFSFFWNQFYIKYKNHEKKIYSHATLIVSIIILFIYAFILYLRIQWHRGGSHDSKVLVRVSLPFIKLLFCKNVFVIFWLDKCICLSVCLSVCLSNAQYLSIQFDWL